MSNLAWDDALWALAALAVDPKGLKGIWLRAPLGPVMQTWLHWLHALKPDSVKIPANIDTERLLGGLDLATTLQWGRPIMLQGLLAQASGRLLICPMAQRLPSATASIVTQVLDTGRVNSLVGHTSEWARIGVVAIDESLPQESALANGLAEQLAMWLDLTHVNPKDEASDETLEMLERIEKKLHNHPQAYQDSIERIALEDSQLRDICELAMGFAIASLRAPWYTTRLASVFAALRGANTISADDLGRAARLVLTPRAKALPASSQTDVTGEDSSPPPEPPVPDEHDKTQAPSDPAQESDDRPEDRDNHVERDALQDPTPPSGLNEQNEQNEQNKPSEPSEPTLTDVQALQTTILESALATLPQGLLNQLAQGQSMATKGNGGRVGQVQKSAQKGRPLPPTKGLPQNGHRLHVLATLRHAAPRQKIRQATPASSSAVTTPRPQGVKRVQILSEDFHVQRFAKRSESCIIFCIDASGSAALERLAEAKGAVELLLKDSYARRDHICVISFRDKSAQLQLPATRSLVRAKRELQAMPGGGGTPLASALKLALETSLKARQRGMTPTLVMLSDGRANVTLQGEGSRPIAKAQSLSWAQQWRASFINAIWLDTSARPDPQGQDIAQAMGANYVPLPLAGSQRMASTVKAIQDLQS